MPGFDFSITICPNAAHGDPHVGHLWYMLHCKHLFDWWSEQNHKYEWGGRPSMRLLFDVHSAPAHRQPFIDMTRWLNLPIASVDLMSEWADWHKVMAMQATCMTGYWQESYKYHHFADLDGEGRLSKLLYFSAHGVYWHVRGCDLYGEKFADMQTAKAYRMRLPLMFYIPLLHDHNDEKIGGANVPDWYLMPQHFEKNPQSVIDALMSSLGIRSIADDCYPGRLQPQHALVDRTLIVAPDWCDDVVDAQLVTPVGDEIVSRVSGDGDL